MPRWPAGSEQQFCIMISRSKAVNAVTDQIIQAARRALLSSPPVGDQAYLTFAQILRDQLARRWPEIAKANAADAEQAAERGLGDSVVERLRLTDTQARFLTRLTHSVQRELPAVAAPGPPVYGAGRMVARRIPRPLGVVLMIYEARPTVTVEGALVCVCAGNAILLRGGSELAATNAVLQDVLRACLVEAGLPADLVQVLDDRDRTQLRELLRRDDAIDVLIPRGSPSLVDFCRGASRIPLIVGGGGVNHLYVDAGADPELAATLVLDSKLPDPAGCTSLEMVLVNRRAVAAFLAALSDRLPRVPADLTEGLRLRLHSSLHPVRPPALARMATVETLASHDDGREFTERTLAVRPVDGIVDAVEHIRRFGTGHTEAIVSQDAATIEQFCRCVDAAAVVVNGSLRLHDGPTIGLGGAELVISTGRLHVRGPVTLGHLMTYSWRIEGHGTVRFLNPAGTEDR
jgi:glutamate-5-semialdehyde dehydrogenase